MRNLVRRGWYVRDRERKEGNGANRLAFHVLFWWPQSCRFSQPGCTCAHATHEPCSLVQADTVVWRIGATPANSVSPTKICVRMYHGRRIQDVVEELVSSGPVFGVL